MQTIKLIKDCMPRKVISSIGWTFKAISILYIQGTLF